MKQSKGGTVETIESRVRHEEIIISDDPRTLQRFTTNDLTRTELRIIEIVAKWPGITMTEIASAWKVTVPSVGQSVRQLIAKGELEHRTITVVDAIGYHHSALALYVKKK